MPSLPLFDDSFSVTESEAQAWLDGIPNLSKSTFRREAYRKAWCVEDKIRSLKIALSKKPKDKYLNDRLGKLQNENRPEAHLQSQGVSR
jgi:primase-polymerase (primpol)-like protein